SCSLVYGLREGRQPRGGNGLTHPAVTLSRQVELDVGQLGELNLENLCGPLLDEDPAPACGYPAQDEHMLAVVKIRVVGSRIAQVAPDAGEDPLRTWVTFRQELLHRAELLRGSKGWIQLDARGWRQLDHGVLGEIFDATAVVPRPFINHSFRIVIHGDEGQFVQPAGEGT